MPKRFDGKKRLAGGPIEIVPGEEMTADGKDKAAVSLGRRGGAARASVMSAEQRSAAAKTAAEKRWGKPTN